MLRLLVSCLLVLALGPAAPAESQTAPGQGILRMELSLLEPQEAACRTYVLMENRTAIDFGAMRFDLVLFDGSQAILRRVAVPSRRLRPQQTRVLVFDVPETACERIGRILLNGVLACQEQGGRIRDDCEDLIRTASRLRIPLVN